MIGWLIGLPAGALLSFFLHRFCKGLTEKGKPPLLYGLGFALFPAAVLIATALLLPDAILFAGVGMTVVLIAFGICFFVHERCRNKGCKAEQSDETAKKDGDKHK